MRLLGLLLPHLRPGASRDTSSLGGHSRARIPNGLDMPTITLRTYAPLAFGTGVVFGLLNSSLQVQTTLTKSNTEVNTRLLSHGRGPDRCTPRVISV